MVLAATPVTWTSWGTCITAVGTIAAVIAATVAGRAAYRLLDMEGRRDDRAESDRVRYQGERVDAWWVHPEDREVVDAELWIGNFSDRPVTAVRTRAGIVVDDKSGCDFFAAFDQPVLAPSLAGRLLGRVSDNTEMLASWQESPARELSKHIVFTDSAGLAWTVDPWGNRTLQPRANINVVTATTQHGIGRASFTVTGEAPKPRRWWHVRGNDSDVPLG
jgi:hypothetical protein